MNVEDSNHFEIGGSTDDGDADVSITCLRCNTFHEWFRVSADESGPAVLLAEIIERADAHVETCPGVYRGTR